MNTEIYHRICAYLRCITKGTPWQGKVYTVGGCCRDAIIGAPIKDLDLAVNLPDGGVKFALWLRRHNLTIEPTFLYPRFGTAKIRLRAFPDDEIEIVQTRKEKYTSRNKNTPETAFGTIEDDCMRRDLTINSLYYDIERDRLLDITGRGIADIRNRVLRTPADPDETYDDDPLRIIRAIRFSARFGWPIDREAYESMKRNAHRVTIIRPERLGREFVKLAEGPHPDRALRLLESTGALAILFPELQATVELRQDERHFGTVWQHTIAVLENLRSDDTALRLAAIFHDIGKTASRSVKKGQLHFRSHEIFSHDITRRILRKFKLDPELIDEVCFLVRHHLDLRDLGPRAEYATPRRRARLLELCKNRPGSLDRLLLLADADNRALAPAAALPYQIPALYRMMNRPFPPKGFQAAPDGPGQQTGPEYSLPPVEYGNLSAENYSIRETTSNWDEDEKPPMKPEEKRSGRRRRRNHRGGKRCGGYRRSRRNRPQENVTDSNVNNS